MSITINGYEYDKETRELLYSSRDSSYYSHSKDPLIRNLYATLNRESDKKGSPFYNWFPHILLNSIFYICACLYEDDNPISQIDNHLGWIELNANQSYCGHFADWKARNYGLAYSCVSAVLTVQATLPKKVQAFMQDTLIKIENSHWKDDFKKAQKIVLEALRGNGNQQQYQANLKPNVSFNGLKRLVDIHPNNLEPFLSPEGIRMVLSRIRNAEERKKAIDIFQNAQRLSLTADLTENWDDFFAELREECEQTGKITQLPTQGGSDKKQREKKANDNCAAKDVTIEQLQQQLAEKDAEIARHKKEVEKLKSAENATNEKHSSNDAEIQRLKEEVEELKKRLETAGKEYVNQIVNEALEGTEDMAMEDRRAKHNERKGLLEMDDVPKKSKDAIRALLKASKEKSEAGTINIINGPVGQVVNSMEEQHITKE